MENWGDPWADNADNDKVTSPTTTTAVTSPLPPAFAPAPALLNGFLGDDAGWGNEDESFGDWSAAPASAEEVLPAKTSMNATYTDNGCWAVVERDATSAENKVASETSTSETTVQEERTEQKSHDDTVHTTADDESSTRASTSPSDTSHNDAPAESPRTSFEEERAAVKDAIEMDTGHRELLTTEPAASSADVAASVSSGDEDDEDAAKESPSAKEHDKDEKNFLDTPLHPPAEPSTSVPEDASKPLSAVVSRNAGTFAIDTELLHELFAPSENSQDLQDAPDDPIYSTSSRKAWYRLTRKQTMREFNNGNDDDNYIRVTWANSHIRTEVNTVVGRWAREDRISGRGPGARASFYWDTPAPPVDMRLTKIRHASQPVLSESAPKRDGISPLATNAPAAFDWSSPSAPVDPWHQSSPGMRAVSSPMPPIQSSAAETQTAQPRGPSMDLTLGKPGSGMQTMTASGETPAVAGPTSPSPFKGDDTSSSDPWTGFDAFEPTPAATTEPVDAPVDDDDEWGEMVSTPTVSTFPAIEQPSSTVSASFATPSTPPQSRTTSNQDDSPETMHAAPIVRLKSAISPTSALFKANSFVPLGVEPGPIGPGSLKSSKRVTNATAIKPVEMLPPLVESAPIVTPRTLPSPATPDVFSEWQTSVPDAPIEVHLEEATISTAEHSPVKEVIPPSPATPANFSDWQTSVPDAPAEEPDANVASATIASTIVPEVFRPSTPPPQPHEPTSSNVDAWADADLSFFESSAPVKTPPKTKRDPSDPFSVFESPARSTSSASSVKTFTRSPPRKVTPPFVQPLTRATSAAQRRKTEEDQIIHDIIGGLPDLGYMLRQ